MSGLLGGVLPAIFSQADRAKRYIGGLLADPVGRMQQAGGQAVDDLSKLGLLSEQAFNDPRNPMKLQDNAAARQLTDTYLNSVMNFAPVGVTRKVGEMGFDPRFDPRVKEQEKLKSLITDVDERVTNVPEVSIADLVGKPFITSMSDRTGVGLLNQVGGVKLSNPVNMQGGQAFMFDNPGMVWASGKQPARQLLQEAEVIKSVTGQNPVYLPWRMAPSGGDFATMTGETMLSYADANMSKAVKRKLDAQIKKAIPGWSSVSSPDAFDLYRAAPDAVRKNLKNMMDTEFRDAGGLSLGQARLAVADPSQLRGPDGGVMNVGEIFADQGLKTKSGHASYPYGVPGEGIGRLKEDINVFQLLPHAVQQRGIPNPAAPRTTDLRALQMKPYAGVITEDLLRRLGL